MGGRAGPAPGGGPPAPGGGPPAPGGGPPAPGGGPPAPAGAFDGAVPAIPAPETSRPSGSISLLADPVCLDISRLAYAVTLTLVPVAKSEGLKPARDRPLTVPNSNPHSSVAPLGLSTVTYIQACGLAHATCLTAPWKTKHLFASNVPPPWCAHAVDAHMPNISSEPTFMPEDFLLIESP